jgi:predicted Fe-S protein YdhL (DUF1289 family)
VTTSEPSQPVTQATSGRKRVYLEIPPNWDQMTDGQQHQVAEAMAEALQRQLGIRDKSATPDKPDSSTQPPTTRSLR